MVSSVFNRGGRLRLVPSPTPERGLAILQRFIQTRCVRQEIDSKWRLIIVGGQPTLPTSFLLDDANLWRNGFSLARPRIEASVSVADSSRPLSWPRLAKLVTRRKSFFNQEFRRIVAGAGVERAKPDRGGGLCEDQAGVVLLSEGEVPGGVWGEETRSFASGVAVGRPAE